MVCHAGPVRVLRVVDLSVPLGPGTQVYPGDPQPRLSQHATIAVDGFNLLSVAMGSQTGTHVDAPYHFETDGARIDGMDLRLFVGTGVVVDARGLGPRGRITRAHVEPVADRLGPEAVVLLWTGWSEHFGSPAYLEHPYLEAEACQELLDRGVRTICIDAINLDETPDATHPGVGYPCHHLVADVGGVIGENLRGFESLDFPDPLVCVIPLALEAADGAPVRAVALQLEP